MLVQSLRDIRTASETGMIRPNPFMYILTDSMSSTGNAVWHLFRAISRDKERLPGITAGKKYTVQCILHILVFNCHKLHMKIISLSSPGSQFRTVSEMNAIMFDNNSNR